MLDVQKGICIAKYFRVVLLEILKRTQGFIYGHFSLKAKQFNHLKFSLTLSHLLPLFSYILPFVLKYFEKNGSFFHQSMEREEFALAVETAYHFLRFSPTIFRDLWNWGSFCEVTYLESVSDQTKWYFLKAMLIVLNCNNEEIVNLFRNHSNIEMHTPFSETNTMEAVCPKSTNDNPLAFTVTTQPSTMVDLTSSQVLINKEQNEVWNEIVFNENDLSEEHMITGSMVIPRISSTCLSNQELVLVPSMLRNIKALSVAFVSGKAVLISGEIGSGKTSLVEHFASLTGRNKPPSLLKVQLGDETDSKVKLDV